VRSIEAILYTEQRAQVDDDDPELKKLIRRCNQQPSRVSWNANYPWNESYFETIGGLQTLTGEPWHNQTLNFHGGQKMKIQRTVLALAFSVASLGVYAQQPDNTKVNERDRATNEPTADQQKNNRTDLDMTKNIRKSIMDDKSLSTYAHNVKVISQNGTVTLKGPVKSDDEKKAVLSKAVAVAGSADKVVDQMSVKQ
jgi:hyperosmotically inducible periplasmic protein